ncbi:hypothetical protein N7447_010846 [Penicillium robsamsonii]|uniref:uncharacterized protein n=1 Tax=Penicillium robsamsonii TaxID=1792511 RepID=UPI0025469BA8|nr:uncharacterized protein N7447_010846 [Penicillium robsamsonii]KAJ5807390.1 hypothetical protein N7447_010846 [Penicillium robsamsonii]
MIQHPRNPQPDPITSEIGPLAMNYLGVPIVVAPATQYVKISMVVVRDEDYEPACQKLKGSGFYEIIPDRTILPEILATLPDPEQAIEEVKREYQRLDNSTTTFEYPLNHHLAGSLRLTLAPNSFANLSIPDVIGDIKQNNVSTKGYDIYRSICHPLEEALVESFVKCVIDDQNDENAEFSGWGDRLSTWVAMMCAYLEVNNDILDSCADERAVKWFSVTYGRIHEERFGPLDRRVSNRLGSGREMPVDMRGNPLPD